MCHGSLELRRREKILVFSNTEKYSLPNCFLDLTSKRRDGVTILLAVYCAIPGTIGKLKLFTGGIVNLVWYHSVPTHSARQRKRGMIPKPVHDVHIFCRNPCLPAFFTVCEQKKKQTGEHQTNEIQSLSCPYHTVVVRSCHEIINSVNEKGYCR